MKRTPPAVAVLLSAHGVSVVEVDRLLPMMRLKDPARVITRGRLEEGPLVIPPKCPLRMFRRLTTRIAKRDALTFYTEVGA